MLLQCCLAEKEYNPFYALLSEKLLTDANYRYTFKYALWDYLKMLEKTEIKQIVSLSKIFGVLISKNAVPLHFLKVIDFEEMNKPTVLFMHLLL